MRIMSLLSILKPSPSVRVPPSATRGQTHLLQLETCLMELLRPPSGGPGRHQDSAEEVDHLPEDASGVPPPRAPRVLQQPEGRLHPAGPRLARDHLLRDLPRPVVSSGSVLPSGWSFIPDSLRQHASGLASDGGPGPGLSRTRSQGSGSRLESLAGSVFIIKVFVVVSYYMWKRLKRV